MRGRRVSGSPACALPAAPSSPTPIELRALTAYATTGDRSKAASSIDVTPLMLRHTLHRAFVRLGVTTAIDAFRVLGWLRVPE